MCPLSIDKSWKLLLKAFPRGSGVRVVQNGNLQKKWRSHYLGITVGRPCEKYRYGFQLLQIWPRQIQAAPKHTPGEAASPDFPISLLCSFTLTAGHSGYKDLLQALTHPPMPGLGPPFVRFSDCPFQTSTSSVSSTLCCMFGFV